MAVSKILANALSSTASITGAPGNPSSTTSTSGVMMGLGAAFKLTPTKTGRFLVILNAAAAVTVATASFTAQLHYGAGTAPANGAAPTGTALGNPLTGWSDVASSPTPFPLAQVITGLTIGTTYWFDASLAVSTGTGSLSGLNWEIIEF